MQPQVNPRVSLLDAFGSPSVLSVGADGEAAPRGDPGALRLARRPPGAAREPGRGGAGPEARRDAGRDAGPDAGGARALLDRIDTGTRVGLRDRALLSVMVYSFARVSAAAGMRRQDYFRQERRGWLRLHEKGGKRHVVPAHHRAEEAVEAYLDAGGVDDDDAKAPLFQSVDRAGGLSGRPLGRRAVLAMIRIDTGDVGWVAGPGRS